MSNSLNNLVDDFEELNILSTPINSEHKRSKSNGNLTKFEYMKDTSCEFFAGNLNKYKTRDELFHDLTTLWIEILGEHLYIRKFNMPKFTARKEGNKYVCNPGYAFVTAKRPEMATELIDRCNKLKEKGEKGIPLGDGSFVDIKPISAVKRGVANQNNKSNSLAKLNGVKTKGNYKNTRNNSDWNRDDSTDSGFNRTAFKVSDWRTFDGNQVPASFPNTDLSKPYRNTDFPSLSKFQDFRHNNDDKPEPYKNMEPSIFNFNYDEINHARNYLHQVSDSSSDPKSPIEAH
jgi:hypothetical protein